MVRKFTIYGEPRGKERPRFTKSGHTYTSKKTRDYEELVRESYKKQVSCGKALDGVPVRIRITAVFGVPQSDSKAKREAKLAGNLSPTKKPDCDNIAKIICDALNGLAYADDKQVVECYVLKEYGVDPHVSVEIEPDFKNSVVLM